jgi:hypothetical protein
MKIIKFATFALLLIPSFAYSQVGGEGEPPPTIYSKEDCQAIRGLADTKFTLSTIQKENYEFAKTLNTWRHTSYTTKLAAVSGQMTVDQQEAVANYLAIAGALNLEAVELGGSGNYTYNAGGTVYESGVAAYNSQAWDMAYNKFNSAYHYYWSAQNYYTGACNKFSAASTPLDEAKAILNNFNP